MPAELNYSLRLNSSVKLNYFHYIVKQLTGYVIHPSINTNVPQLRVADFGTQTAIWPIDVVETYAKSNATVVGLDVSDATFPPKEWLGDSVKLRIHDVFQSLDAEEDMRESFDVVHLRWWLSRSQAQVLQLLDNAAKLLKPGGCVQWFEHDKEATRVVGHAENLNAEAMTKFVELVRKPFPAYEVGWIDYIPAAAKQIGLEVVATDRVAMRPIMYPQLNEIHVLGLDDAPRGLSAALDSFKDDHMREFERLCQSGMSTNYEFVCFVLRKPAE